MHMLRIGFWAEVNIAQFLVDVRAEVYIALKRGEEKPTTASTEMSMDRIHPWIGLDWVGLDWIGSDDCYVQNYDGLCFSAEQTKTVLCSDFCFFTFHS